MEEVLRARGWRAPRSAERGRPHRPQHLQRAREGRAEAPQRGRQARAAEARRAAASCSRSPAAWRSKRARSCSQRVAHLDLVVGPDNIAELPALARRADAPARRPARAPCSTSTRRASSPPRPTPGAAPVSAFVTIDEGLRRALLVLHRPVHARPRALPPAPRRSSPRSPRWVAAGVARGHAARADREQLPRPVALAAARPSRRSRRERSSPRCSARIAARRARPRAPALHEPAPAPRHAVAHRRPTPSSTCSRATSTCPCSRAATACSSA